MERKEKENQEMTLGCMRAKSFFRVDGGWPSEKRQSWSRRV